MKQIIKLFIPLLLIFTSIGCKKSYDDLYKNNNTPTSVPPYLLLRGIENDIVEEPFSYKEIWNQYFLYDYDYYGNNRYDFGEGDNYYNTLKNVARMEEEAKNTGLPDVNVYGALAKFFKAYLFTRMSLQQGDIPVTQALQGIDNLSPTYDSQKQVFLQAFSWLDSANTELTQLIAAKDNNLQGDFYFKEQATGGMSAVAAMQKWQKVVNAVRLRLLINLSKKADDPDINLRQQFSAILGDKSKYPVMESADDDLKYIYINPTNKYPNNPGNFGFDAGRHVSSKTYIGLLTSLHDPRVFVTADPADSLVRKGNSPTSFEAFAGADPGEDLGNMYKEATLGLYSGLNRKRFYDTYTGEPSIQVGYAEMCFTIAEAINRGFVTGDGETYYRQGILTSMASYGIPQSGPFNVYFLHPGASLGSYDTYTVNSDFENYYGQPDVKYAGNNATGLTEILQQKYLALFRHAGLESYYQFRRTGVPQFTTGPGTGNSNRIALRFKYPNSELTANPDNYQAALQSQYGGNDDINGTMWLLK